MSETKSSREEKAIKTKKQILETATTLFLSKDFNTVSTNEIASAANVAKGSVFHHFGNKELLALAVLDNFMVQMLEQIRQLRKELDPQTIINTIVEMSFDVSISSPGVIQLILQMLADKEKMEAEPENEIEKRIKDEMLYLYDLLQQYIDEFTLVFKELGHEDPETQSRIFLGLLDGLGLQVSLLLKPDKKLFEKLTKGIINLFTKQEDS
ncbi:MAG: TetR/AcrR family transcriptional regulator [Candidatus Kariarchaeaceae archaeon]|jgi:AcrR family transcriptional regulator